MKTRLVNNNGKEIYSDLSVDCNDCIAHCSRVSEIVICPIFSNKRRRGKLKNILGEIYCCTDDHVLLKSSSIFKGVLETKLQGLKELQEIKEEINQDTKRLIHNLTTTNGHNIQELYALVPQELLTHDIRNQLETIKKLIIEDPHEAAKTFLRIAKNNAAMKVEFTVFNKLIESSPVLQKKNHQIQKVVLNLFHIFFQDFSDLGVRINVQENSDYLFIEYESFHTALYPIIENTTKYVLPHTAVNVKFTNWGNSFSILFDMQSIRIEKEEINKIKEEGYSGINSRKIGKYGQGIGLSRAVQVLKLNNAELIIHRNYLPSSSKKYNSVWYDWNQFEIRFGADAIIQRNNVRSPPRVF